MSNSNGQINSGSNSIQESLSKFINSLSEGFELLELIYDKQGNVIDFRFLEVNPAFEKQTGLNAGELIGKLKKENAPASDQRWYDYAIEAIITGKTLDYDYYNDKISRHLETQFIPISTSQIAVLFKDITERKRLEQQLKEKERLAAIGETAGMVGHDLRNPLQTIVSELFLALNDLEAMPDSSLKASLKESLDGISEQIDYMDKIVSDLQTFVKPVEFHNQLVNLRELTKAALIQINIPENIQTSVDIEENLTVETDPQLLKRVLINLITNAIQAMPQGGELAITLCNNGNGRIKILVEDTGEGIPNAIKPKIFTPLFTTKSKGQGFGLAVCKRVIEAQNGTINFESDAGKGTKFIIELPLQK